MPRFLNSVFRSPLVLAWLLLALSGVSRASEQKILVFGDSISAAYGMSLEQGWVAQLETKLKQQNPDVSVVNASISGETTAGGVRRLPSLLAQHQPGVVIIELGANDGMRGYPLKTLRNNLLQMVNMAQQTSARVILLPMQIPPNYGVRYANGFYQTYLQVAEDTNAVLAPFILEQVALDPTLMQTDGIHPTVEAQAMMLDTVLPTIMRELPRQ